MNISKRFPRRNSFALIFHNFFKTPIRIEQKPYIVSDSTIGIAAFLATGVLLKLFITYHPDTNAVLPVNTEPLIKAINEYWFKVLLLTGSAGVLIGAGNIWQRALRAIVYGLSGGAVMVGLLLTLP